nr:MSMEG_6728 family protein [Auraticoccus cholistanensis]
MPYADFAASARVLDQRRLGKQRVETLQVMRALTVAGYGWRHHPVAKMWRGHRGSLMDYQVAVCAEWVSRGFGDTCLESTLAELALPSLVDPETDELAQWRRGEHRPPWWLGQEAVHRSHRSKLLQKDPAHYGPLFPGTPDDLDYVWPGPDVRPL